MDTKQDLWFSTKDTISKVYDGAFKEIFEKVYADYADEFKRLNIEYFYTLIDDAVHRVIRSEGGYIWACKNYDGDVMSDMVSTVFGSLSLMTSVLVSPDGKYVLVETIKKPFSYQVPYNRFPSVTTIYDKNGKKVKNLSV